MAQGKSPRNLLAFASVLYPGRCLAVELAVPQSEESSQMGALTRPGPRPGSPTSLLPLGRAWREMSHLSVVLCNISLHVIWEVAT